MTGLMKELGSQTAWSTPAFTSLITAMSSSKGAQPSTLPIQYMAQLANSLLPFDHISTRGKCILDVGCGPGQVTTHLLEEYGGLIMENPIHEGGNDGDDGAKMKINASDFSPPMISQFQTLQKAEIEKGNKNWENVSASVCDAQDLTPICSDGKASHVFASLVLFIVPEPRRALRSIYSKLMEGGVLVCSSWKESEWMEMMEIGVSACEMEDDEDPKEPKELKEGKTTKPQVKKRMDMPKAWSSVEGVRKELEETGFRDVDVCECKAEWAFESYEEIVDKILGFPGVMAMVDEEKWRDGGRARARAWMLVCVKDRYKELPASLKGVAVVGVGRK